MNRRAFFKALLAAPVAAKAVAAADFLPVIYGELSDDEGEYIDFDYSGIDSTLKSWHDVRHFKLEAGTIICGNWSIVNKA